MSNRQARTGGKLWRWLVYLWKEMWGRGLLDFGGGHVCLGGGLEVGLEGLGNVN